MKFFADRIAGLDYFRCAFDTLPTPSETRAVDVAALLGVTPATVRAWLAGSREPPRAAVVALWHESHLGRSETAPHSEYGAYLARSMADSLARDLDAARATIEALTRELAAAKQASAAPLPANDPVFNWYSPGTRPRSDAPCTRA
jgi:transcriptional regulator with XRE-family HTH domain